MEIRKLKDTYKTFGCEDGVPTYQYDLKKGAVDGFLIMPKVIDARTKITTQLLSEEGYKVTEEDSDEEIEYNMKDFEKKFFNEETNIAFCKAFLNNAKRDPVTDQIGKTIIFCVRQHHAVKIVEILNKLTSSPKSNFATQVSSDVSGCNDMTTQFRNNRLGGRSAILDEYESSETRVVATVGMMSTGYDCPDLLNIVMMKPIFSPSDFVQIKGRGTRRFDFVYEDQKEAKDNFYLFDFFGNCDYFENDFEYDKKLELPTSGKMSVINEPSKSKEEIELGEDDQIEIINEYQVSQNGQRIDREMSKPAKVFEDKMATPEVRKIYEEDGIEATINYFKNEVFDRPNDYLNPDKIRKSYDFKPRYLSLEEIFQKALGIIPFFKNKEQRLDDLYSGFIGSQKLDLQDPIKNQLLRQIFELTLTDSGFERYDRVKTIR